MKILITGADGYLGTELAWALAQRHHNLSMLIYSNASEQKEQFLKQFGMVYRRDIALDDCRDCFDGADIVFHLAAVKNADRNNAIQFYNNNIIGTHRVLNWMQDCKCRKIYFASSYFVYGNSCGPYKENDFVSPSNLYAVSKIVSEIELKERIPGNYTILRMSHICGKNAFGTIGDDALSKIVTSVAGHMNVVVSTLNEYDFLSVSECAQILSRLAELDVRAPVVNIGSGKSYSLETIFNGAKSAYATSRSSLIRDAHEENIFIRYQDIGLMKKCVGDVPSSGIDVIIAEMIAGLK